MNPSIASETAEKPTSGQKETCTTLVTDAARKSFGTAWDELVANGVLTKRTIERIRARGNQLVAKIMSVVKTELAEMAELITGYVKMVSGAETLTLDSTDGKATIAKAADAFPGWIDPDFKEYGTNVRSEPTKEANVTVHEMIKDGTFAQIFGGMNDDLNKLVLTQPQIIQFVTKHGKWLRSDGYGTFFLFKVSDEFFVARVDAYSGGLGVLACRLSYDRVWYAEYRHRLVVPQLTLEN